MWQQRWKMAWESLESLTDMAVSRPLLWCVYVAGREVAIFVARHLPDLLKDVAANQGCCAHALWASG